MCGIGGIVRRDGGLVHPNELQSLAERMRHRGPDARGFASYKLGGRLSVARESGALPAGTTGLVHLRLAIIDTSDAGWQPMRSIDGRFTIVFNGEIYNYVELRDELVALGHRFCSTSDTEVLLAAWAQWGPASLTRLVGMFAFAILDVGSNTITLARDGFGIKPLFYASSPTSFVFASELKGLLPLLPGGRRLDAMRVFDYLRSGKTDAGGSTMLRDIHQVPPGHWAAVQLETNGPPSFKPFWVPSPREQLDISYEDAVRRTRELFTRSVSLHLRSDVPVGACLSGGIDSSAIVCLMRELAGNALDLHTFTYVSDSPADSEAAWATLVARKTGAVVHETTPAATDLVDDFETLILSQDEPFGSTSIFAQHWVFRLVANEGIKVVLDGQGADELLGGYAHHMGARLASLIRAGRIGEAWHFWQNTPAEYAGTRQARLLAAQYLLPTFAHAPIRRLIGRSAAPPWLNVEWFRDNGAEALTLGPGDDQSLKAALLSDVRNSLPSLLRYEDRNSMHFSIESRVPFLIPELYDFLLSLPDEFIISNDGISKSVFRAAMRGIVPDAILDRRDKIGFRTPEWRWIKAVRPWAERILESEAGRALPVFRHKALRAAWRTVLEQPARYNPWVWRWINFIRWAEINDVEV